jgi:ABC-type Fe3+-hydroxamate transport system substrate-binding protein
MIEVTDAIDRQVRLERPPNRVVSLVPSETLSVVELVGIERLVGRTDYCVEPAGAVQAVPSVGGTKGFDVEAVKALQPDLVLANKEENSRPLVQALISAGLPVHVSFPCTVDQSLAYLEGLCLLLAIDAEEAAPVNRCRAAVESVRRREHADPLPAFVPIWKDPWMTFDEGAYASDLLRVCGAHNVFAGRPRQYPLAADLGISPPSPAERTEGRDTRYPRVRLEEVVDRGARVAFLPDEPYAFGEDDAAAFADLGSPEPIAVELVDGKDLFWYGTHVARAVERLSDQVALARARCFGSAPNN